MAKMTTYKCDWCGKEMEYPVITISHTQPHHTTEQGFLEIYAVKVPSPEELCRECANKVRSVQPKREADGEAINITVR